MARINGCDIRISVRGEGTPLLLIMGIGASLDMWEPFEREMAPHGYQLISFDLPGVGASPTIFPPKRMRGLAKIAVGVLDELDIFSADVLGVSLGGGVAQEVARLAPKRIKRLVLAATMPGLGGVAGNPLVTRHMLSPKRYHDPEFAMKIAGAVYGGEARKNPKSQGPGALRYRRPPSTYGYLAQSYAVWGWSSVPYLWRVPVPTLVLAGDDDPLMPMLNARLMTFLLPHGQLSVIEGGGHLFLIERPAESADVVNRFLANGVVAS